MVTLVTRSLYSIRRRFKINYKKSKMSYAIIMLNVLLLGKGEEPELATQVLQFIYEGGIGVY